MRLLALDARVGADERDGLITPDIFPSRSVSGFVRNVSRFSKDGERIIPNQEDKILIILVDR